MGKYIAIILLFLVSLSTFAQCDINNTSFKAGETLKYDLYYKYGIINAKAGNASLTLRAEKHKGTEALKATLLARSTGAVKRFYSIDDTLSCYFTKTLRPLHFIKKTHEGGKYRDETMDYTYKPDNKVDIRTIRYTDGDFKFDEVVSNDNCVYDMVSIIYYSRSIDYSSLKKGDIVKVDYLAGMNKGVMNIEYKGEVKSKGNDGREYNCIRLSLNLKEASGDEKPVMNVDLSNDTNRIPIRLEMYLNVGYTRAIIKSYTGLKH